MADYFMGLDNGGTLCKAVIFDADGRTISHASRELVLETPEAGFTERNMNALWEANCAVIREAIEKSQLDSSEIKAAAVCGHGKGLYLWGKDEKPAYAGIVSTDSRAYAYPEKWKSDGTAARVFEKTFQSILASQPVSLLCWLRDHRPGVLENTRWIFECKDYIRYRLTGEAFAELTDYSGSNLLNIRDRCFDQDLLREYGLENLFEALPPLKNSAEICGYVTKESAERCGLAEGTPIAGGMFDIDACAVAMDITEDEIAVIAGTWSINEYISRTPVTNHSIMMNSFYAADNYYLIEECSPTSAGNLKWFTDMFLQREKDEALQAGKDVYAYLDDLAETVSPNDADIIFLPFLYGSNYNPLAKAGVIGLDSHHTRPQIVRAVLECIAFCHRVHISKLLANRTSTRAIRLAGGAAASRLWAQIFADVTGLPVERVQAKELGALGAAMAAAVAFGKFKDFHEAAHAMVMVKDQLVPNDANREIYDQKFQRYQKCADALEILWQ
jgi:L-xylulokinase